MKKTFCFILCVGLVSVASAATKKNQTPAEEAPTLPMTQLLNSFSVYLDNTTFDNGGDDDETYSGIRLAYDRSFGKWQYGYYSFHASLACAQKKKDGAETTLSTVLLGADANLKLSDQAYAYAGPRLGTTQIKWEVDGGDDDSVNRFNYGLEAGVRYFVNDRWNIQASFRYTKYQEKDDAKPTSTSFSIGGGYAF